MEEEKEKASIGHRVFCAASDQSLDFLSRISIFRNAFLQVCTIWFFFKYI